MHKGLEVTSGNGGGPVDSGGRNTGNGDEEGERKQRRAGGSSKGTDESCGLQVYAMGRMIWIRLNAGTTDHEVRFPFVRLQAKMAKVIC